MVTYTFKACFFFVNIPRDTYVLQYVHIYWEVNNALEN